MKKALVFSVMALLALPVSAFAWHPVYVCDGGDLVIDQSESDRDLYQIVLRRNAADWLVHQTGLVPANRMNQAGEVVQGVQTNSEYGMRHYLIETGTYLQEVRLGLENFPPRLEAQSYNPKYGSQGPVQTYYFHYCQM